jgi:hypothetical protein
MDGVGLISARPPCPGLLLGCGVAGAVIYIGRA